MAMESIRESAVPALLWEKLQLWLPVTAPSVTGIGKISSPEKGQELDRKRILLRQFATDLITTEGNAITSDVDFLPIHPLGNLAKDHTGKVPVVIAVGAKGAGKTYSFFSIARSRRWHAFVNKACPGLMCGVEAPILPVLWSSHADQGISQFRKECQQMLGLANGESGTVFDIRRALNSA